MTANKSIVRTESQKKSSCEYVKKTTVQLTVKCHIEKFEALMNTTKPGGGRLWSDEVSSELAPRAVWKLSVDPNGSKEEEKGNISVYLWLTGPMKDSKENLDATYHFYLVDGSGKTDSIGRNTKSFGKERHYCFGWSANHDRAKKALQADGALVVAAYVEFLPPNDRSAKAISESVIHGYEHREQWADKFSELHGDEASYDCSIQIGGVSIPAFKYPLMAQSPIFRSMFTHQEAEEFQSSVVKITDFKEHEPMRALIHYCYMGFLDTEKMDGDGAMEILKLADRYCVTELKALLEQHFISRTLSMGNAVALAVLADMHTAPKLKEACIKLIASGGDAVFEIAEWKEHSDKELIAEVFQLAEKYSIPELKSALEKHFINKRLSVDNVVSMIVLADTHSIHKLKEACIKLIIDKRLNVGNVVSMAVLADTLSAEKLKEACTKLIADKGKTVYDSVEWKELEETNSKLTTGLAVGAATVLAGKLVKSDLAADLAKKEAAVLAEKLAKSELALDVAKKEAAEQLAQSELALDLAKKEAAEPARKKLRFSGSCYNCGEPGHLSRDCLTPAAEAPSKTDAEDGGHPD